MSIAIDSEDDAWRTLSQLINGELDTASVDELEFGDWVKLERFLLILNRCGIPTGAIL